MTPNHLFAVAGDVCGKMNDPILNINDSGKNLEDKRLVSSMITNWNWIVKKQRNATIFNFYSIFLSDFCISTYYIRKNIHIAQNLVGIKLIPMHLPVLHTKESFKCYVISFFEYPTTLTVDRSYPCTYLQFSALIYWILIDITFFSWYESNPSD